MRGVKGKRGEKGTEPFLPPNFSENDRIYGRFSRVSAPADVQPVYPNATADFRGAMQTRTNLVTTINYSHNFAPTDLPPLIRAQAPDST